LAHTPEECKSIFVTWAKMFGILTASIVVAMGGTWQCATAEAQQNEHIREQTRKVARVERIVDVIENQLMADMDTLKRIAREGR